ncbi:MAG: A/G-specific adenine glycosylase [Chloroflexi bacterium]|nr:MAG: A/G-specific adenine glycosylase [Chloroflexota bacterium]MBL1194506.1 A/G-specific adenine glycosylase [Chloroflexota bacterium]NOH11794.1 A/G-specific adenine glycosylase [Chloroflexota bacterium]
MPKKRSLTKKLLTWYRANKRSMPWRDHPDPYAVWVSEIMLQQTRVETVVPYFERWMMRFTTIGKLAAASQQDVLNLWEGLGYYSRARNLHKAAQVVVDEHQGALPADLSALQKLPGVGRYTAGAIASLGFGLDAPVVDGNIKRVLARIFNVEEAVDTTVGEKRIWALAEEYLPGGEAKDYNQALMELGATICTPRNPKCETCPVNTICEANKLDLQGERPVTKPKAEVPHYTVAAAVIQKRGRVLLAQRPADGLLGGMWEYPGGKQEDGESLPVCLRREIREELGVKIKVGEELGLYRHAYSHFRVTLHAFLCELKVGKPKAIEAQAIKWVWLKDLGDYPMGKLDRMISETIVAKR